ncbi:MAG TPA: ferritin family protein [Anaerolineae bacterium]|nr:ferritin family protein [Anaerolineae bacterium]
MNEDTAAALLVLREAVRNELDGQAMYLQAAEQTKEELGKSMFRSFAKEEDQHVHILQAQYAQVNESGDWLDLKAARKAPRDPELILFPQEEGEVREIVPEGTGDLEALKIAMEFEQRAVRMYEKAAEDSSDPTSQAFYRELAEWEGTHYRILDNSHDYLATKGEWYFQEVEMPMYEG